MIQKLIFTLCVFICVHTYAQNIGDFRTKQLECTHWQAISNWEQFDGLKWINATEYPGKSYSPTLVSIVSNSTIYIDSDIWDIPLQNLTIESNALCFLENINLKILNQFKINGTFVNKSSIGNSEFNSITIEDGIWQNNQQKNYSILGDCILSNGKILGDASSNYTILGNFYTVGLPSTIDKAGIIVNGETHFEGNITFTSTSGDKIFRNSVYLKNCIWLNSVGETFNCNSDLILDNGTISNEAFAEFTIAQNLISNGGKLTRYNDFYGTFSIINNVIIEGNTTIIESACLNIQENIEIRGTLEITDKKGVKTIENDFIIEPTGIFKNTSNDRIILNGNLINKGTFNNGTNGIFELNGLNKNIQGIITTPRLQINGIYTNLNSLDVKSDFIGTGKLIQSENASLFIQSPTSPLITANAFNNSVTYTKRANQYINCNEFYNLILANNGYSVFATDSIHIINTLQFDKQCFLNCNENTLTFDTWNNQKITGISIPDRGIILQNGKVVITDLDSNMTASIPIFTNNSIDSYSRIEITNYDKSNTLFTIDSVNTAITSSGFSNTGKTFTSDCVGKTFFISSESNNALLQLYWHKSSELLLFERNLCSVIHHNGNNWETISEEQEAIKYDSYDIYSAIGKTHSFSPFSIKSSDVFLPISLLYFKGTFTENKTELVWETASESNNSYFTILKSINGFDFYPIATILGNGTTNESHTYNYIDNELDCGLVYYKLQQTDFSNKTTEFETISILKNNIDFLIQKKDNSIKIQVINEEIIKMTLYTVTFEKVVETNSKTLYYNSIIPGNYLLEITTNKGKTFKKIHL